MKMNLNRIARETGYALSTVSRALNDSPKVAEKTKREILAYANRFGYKKERKTIAILVPAWNFEDLYFRETVHELIAEASCQGYEVIILPDNSLSFLENYNLAAAFSLISLSGIESWWDKRYTFPLIGLNVKSNLLDNIYSVLSDDRQGIELLVTHLTNLGHKRIAYIGSGFLQPAHFENNLRFQAFQEKMRNLTLRDDLYMDTHGRDEELFFGIHRLLEEKPTAFLCACEQLPQKVIYHLYSAGYRVPDDFSVTGIVMPGFDQYCLPPITGIQQNLPMLARQAIGLFHQLLQGRPIKQNILIPYQFCSRLSTAPYRKKL
jgi:DNA-binding LacI/PurR family transcriptional regulator